MADTPLTIPDEVLLNATNQYFSFLPEWCKSYLVYLMQMVIRDPYGFIKSVFILLFPLFVLSAICSYFLLKEMRKDEHKQKSRDKIKQRAQKAIKSKEEKLTSGDKKVVAGEKKSPSPSPGKSKKSQKKDK